MTDVRHAQYVMMNSIAIIAHTSVTMAISSPLFLSRYECHQLTCRSQGFVTTEIFWADVFPVGIAQCHTVPQPNEALL